MYMQFYIQGLTFPSAVRTFGLILFFLSADAQHEELLSSVELRFLFELNQVQTLGSFLC